MSIFQTSQNQSHPTLQGYTTDFLSEEVRCVRWSQAEKAEFTCSK